MAKNKHAIYLGNFLLNYRKKKGLERKSVANDIGIGTKTLYRLENGLGNPTLDTIIALLNYYGIEVSLKSELSECNAIFNKYL